MPSSLSLPSCQQPQHPQALLDSLCPFLRGELEPVDKNLPGLIAVLRSAGAGKCSHKHGSFLEHLVDIYRILKIWKAPDSVCLCGLFHSAYSNAYYSDSELMEHLKLSEIALNNAKEEGLLDRDEVWRKKLRLPLPEDGIVVKNIKTGENVTITRRVMAVFLLMSMADYSDQFFSYQDLLFDNFDGRFRFLGNNYAALWPGDGKPGLWMNSISKMGAVYILILRDEGIILEERKRVGGAEVEKDRDEGIELVVPPVFENCTRVLDAKEQVEARDLYWEAICDGSKSGVERAEDLLLGCTAKNPFVGEPHVVLAQVYLNKGRFVEAEQEAERGLTLMLEWGSPWDKRMSWEGWIAWARVLPLKAKEKSWPQSAWGVLSLGLR
ncbi:Uncharacterized protein TCM_007656 [Theobroma cacao]|uniref:DUF6817 domain-containing protein n=1 Tax=Theobroma cacao TaxID=3641 RepID=A0A061E9Q8_THECC|nr:Uncharacterized protein TCM_007656 [Theobroma cacao]